MLMSTLQAQQISCNASAITVTCEHLQGEHPKHKGVSDAGLLGTVERYFVEIMAIPRLQQRIDCFIFTRSFHPAMQRVRHSSQVLPPDIVKEGSTVVASHR